MQEITRNSYSLYKRETGNRTIWYVRFWDDETQSYSSGRSTGQTTNPAAHRQAQKWLREGIPEFRKRDHTAVQNRLMGAIAKHLQDAGIIKKGEIQDPGEIIKLFYTQVTNTQMSSGEGFVAYLYRFWDWNGAYVQGRIERGKTIGKRYVEDCRKRIESHIEPFFKDTLLCDITTKSLEDFMRSIPRRDLDPKNGYARKTINFIVKVIKKALKDAIRLGILVKNPADGIELLADDSRERGILSPSEMNRLFQLEWIDKRGKIASILAAVSGMRLSEITALQIENLNPEQNVIHVLHSYTPYEKRLKTTKTGKSRIIYTDSSIIQMLTDLHKQNPYQGSYIFWGLHSDKPIRLESIERHLEKALAALLGEEIRKSITEKWQEIALNLASLDGVKPDEIIAIGENNIDMIQNCLHIRHSYNINNTRLIVLKENKERIIPVKPSVLQWLTSFCRKEPYVFIFGGKESQKLIDFEHSEAQKQRRLTLFLGEIARKERNISFHGFRHFFNSAIRGTVSDDILRLQTGHADEKMTDLYDHMTDDRGEQLRKAVQAKILPFIPKVAGE
jgi:integrase